tara:strand:- start:190 stop:360 length:171 start_codon:yes stop_codon:yes gene_type:complete
MQAHVVAISSKPGEKSFDYVADINSIYKYWNPTILKTLVVLVGIQAIGQRTMNEQI